MTAPLSKVSVLLNINIPQINSNYSGISNISIPAPYQACTCSASIDTEEVQT